MKLYELTTQYASIENWLDDNDEASSGLIQQALQDLENLEGDISKRFDALVKIIKNYEVTAEGYEAEVERLSKKRAAIDKKIKNIKGYLLSSMGTINADKIQTSIAVIRRQKSPMSANIIDMDKVPDQYKYTPEPVELINKASIIYDFKKTGEIIPGVEVVQNHHIRIY